MFPYPPVRVWVLLCLMIVGATSNLLAIDRLVPQEYPTIQEGINAAQTGDIVLVSPGVYNELIDFLGKTITVRSTDGPAVTIIDGGGNGPIVTFQNLEGPGSVLEGFTITNGVAAEGAGITILDAYPTILNNTISSNTATTGPGAGILMRNYTPNIDVSLIPQIAGNIISSNVALKSAGGGLYAYSGYDFPKLSGNTWSENFGSLASTLFVTSSSGENTGIQLQGEHITSSYDQAAPNSIAPSTIKISYVDFEIADSEIQIHNSVGWDSGIESYNKQSTFRDTTISMFGDTTSSSNYTQLSRINTNELLLSNLTLINESSSPLPKFYTYLAENLGNITPNIHSNGLISDGVLSHFYSKYDNSNLIILLENTTLTSAPIRVDAYQYYGGNHDISIKKLRASGTAPENIDNLIYVESSGYYGVVDSNIKFSEIEIRDVSIPDSMSSILKLNNWSSANVNLSMRDILIDNSTHSGNAPLDLVDIRFADSYYSSVFSNTKVDNMLLASPSSTTTAVRFTQSQEGKSYSSNIISEVSLSNLTLAGDFSSSGTIVSAIANGYYSYFNPIDISVDNSIVEGTTPFTSLPDSNAAILTVSNSLTNVPLSGQGNITGYPEFVSGPGGDHYLAQISSGNSTDSLGVDSADPNTSAPFLGGTRSDGGLDTGTPDIGFHYSTRSEISSVNLVVDDAAIYFEPGTGLIDSDVISIYLAEDLQPGFSPSQYRGLSLRLLQEPGSLQINSVSLASELLTVLGSEPDYFEALVCNDVVSVGMIPSLSDPSLTFTVSPALEVLHLGLGAGTELAALNSVVETQLIPQDGPGCGGTLHVNNLVTDSLGNTTLLNVQPVRLTLVPHSRFRRGDANADGNTDLGDAVALLSFLFNGYDGLTCEDAADSNDDGLIDVADPVFLLAALFTGGPAPTEPGQFCGPDPTVDLLRCDTFSICTPDVSLTTVRYAPLPGEAVKVEWETVGPIDHYQIAVDGIVHQRLGGETTETTLFFNKTGLTEVCLWVLAEGALIESCQQVLVANPVSNLQCSADTTGTSVEFQWTPDSEFQQIEIYGGDQLLTIVESDTGFASLPLPTQNTQYCLLGTTSDLISTSICCEIIIGDDCITAQEIPISGPGIYTINMDTSNATDSGFPSPTIPCNTLGAIDNDIWFSITPDQDMTWEIHTCDPSSWDTDLIVYEGSDCTLLTAIACDGDGVGLSVCQSYYSRIYGLQLYSGLEYKIRIGSWAAGGFGFGTLTLNAVIPQPEVCDDGIDNDGDLLMDCYDPDCVADLFCFEGDDSTCSDGIDNDVDGLIDCIDPDCVVTAPCPPAPNDDCANSQLVGEGSFPWDNSISTPDGPNECDGNMTNDIWFLYTATNDGTAMIQTCNGGGTNADTVLIVYDGVLGCPTAGSSCLASGDDQCVNETNGPAFMSSTQIPVVAGESYYIQVGGRNGTLGTGVLDISISP